MSREGAYRALYAAGTGLLGLGVAVGAYHSLASERRLPVLSLSEILDGYLGDIEASLERGDAHGAEVQARLALDLVYQSRQRTYDVLGRALLAQGRLEEATRQFRRAVELDPAFAQAYNNLGIAYARRELPDQAVAEFRRALSLDPRLDAARENLARLEARVAGRPAAGAPGGSAGETASADVALARVELGRFYRGELEQLHARFDDSFAAKLSLEGLAEMQRTIGSQLGAEVEVLAETVSPLRDTRLYVRRARFERFAGEVEVLVQLAPDDRVAGLMFRPAGADGAATP